MLQSKKTTGFTLLEIIVALFVFSIVSLIMVSALHNILNIQSGIEKKATRLAQLQIALLLISRDIEQTINRPVANASNKIEGFIGTPNAITFTHAGLTNPFGQLNRTTLQRTHYQLEESNLIRVTWPVLDQTSETTADKRILLNFVTGLQFDYLDNKGQFQKNWPPLNQPNAILPRAVRISLALNNWGKISQLYIIAGQPSDKPN
ncbi:MAG: type II secretion system minor pseudopilin GspJ [Gammaproteobacteria bacterium]